MSAPNHELSAAVAGELKKAIRGGHVVLTRRGRPIAYILPTAIYDEEDVGYMTDPEFWKTVQKWRDDARPTIPLEQVLKEMNEKEAATVKPARTRAKRIGTKGRTQHATA